MNGLINVHKEAGMTSHDVVFRLRKILGTKKIGHAGTLDPEASGVLVAGVGKGTRILEYAGEGRKTYDAEIVFGLSSSTEDLHGKLKEEAYDPGLLSAKRLEAVLGDLSGSILAQIPPMYSSVKVAGRKLYQYARAGQEVERQSRNVELYSLELLTDLYEKDGRQSARFRATVSKGTYIRTLCVELGSRLGVPAVMGSLVRTAVGAFHLEDALTLHMLEEKMAGGDHSFLKPLVDGVKGTLPLVHLKEEDYQKIRLGQKIPNTYPVEDGCTFAGLFQDSLACILLNQEGLIRIMKNVGEE